MKKSQSTPLLSSSTSTIKKSISMNALPIIAHNNSEMTYIMSTVPFHKVLECSAQQAPSIDLDQSIACCLAEPCEVPEIENNSNLTNQQRYFDFLIRLRRYKKNDTILNK
jgi:hypothetical protein